MIQRLITQSLVPFLIFQLVCMQPQLVQISVLTKKLGIYLKSSPLKVIFFNLTSYNHPKASCSTSNFPIPSGNEQYKLFLWCDTCVSYYAASGIYLPPWLPFWRSCKHICSFNCGSSTNDDNDIPAFFKYHCIKWGKIFFFAH